MMAKIKNLKEVLIVDSYKELTLMPLLRLIVTGCRVGPPIQDTVNVLGDEICQKRFEKFKLMFK